MTEIDTQAELDLLGEGPAATEGDHLDEHALLDQTPPPSDENNGKSVVKSEELKNEEVDLYDDAIAPSSAEKSLAPTPARPHVTQQNGSTSHPHPDGKRYCCYIGNLVWWATDAEVAEEACMNMGTIRIGATGTVPAGPPPMMGPRMGPGAPGGGAPMPMMPMRPGPGGPPMNMGGGGPMGPGGGGPMGPGNIMNRGPVMMGQPVNQVCLN
ncbi:hypothetical protein COOONC_09472 [Cooperia oncophora]